MSVEAKEVLVTGDVRPALGPKGQATRKGLLDAAEEVFGEVSYDQASIAEITRRAGVSNGTFYLYFPSKRTIYAELVRQIGHNLRAFTAEAVSGITNRRQFERKGFEAFFEFMGKHPRTYRIVRQSEFIDRDAFRDYYVLFAEGYIEGLKRASAKGEIRSIDPEVAAWCVMGIGDLTGIRWILLNGDDPVPDSVIDSIIDFIFHGMAPREP